MSVNVGRPKLLTGTQRGNVLSAIHKTPVNEKTLVSGLNLDGDEQADPEHHGGPGKAVYVYAAEDYSFWEAELGRKIPAYGWFGENLTIQGASSDAICFGDIWRIGSVILRVTEPRSPCFKLDHKVGIRNFAARFRRTGRVGFYNQVLEEGYVQSGDEGEILDRHPSRLPISLISNVRHAATISTSDVQRLLDTPDLPEAQRAYARRRMMRIQRAVWRGQ